MTKNKNEGVTLFTLFRIEGSRFIPRSHPLVYTLFLLTMKELVVKIFRLLVLTIFVTLV